MCDFEDIDLNQVRAKNETGMTPKTPTGTSMEDGGKERIEAEDQRNDANEGGEDA